MKKIFTAITIVCFLAACQKEYSSKKANSLPINLAVENAPNCILNMITGFQNMPVQNPAARVYEYDYKNQKVYYVTSGCCDQYNYLYNSNCEIICAPDGGIAGSGDYRCPDFISEAKNEKLIWKDER